MSTTTTTTLRSTTPVSGNSDETGRLSASISSNTSNELSNAPTTRTSTLAKILPDAPASLRPEYRLETQRRLFPDKFHSVGLISSRGRRRHRKTSNTCVYRPTDETGLHMSHRNVKNLKHVWQILTLRETGIMPPLPSIHAPSHLHCTVSAELQRRSVEGLCWQIPRFRYDSDNRVTSIFDIFISLMWRVFLHTTKRLTNLELFNIYNSRLRKPNRKDEHSDRQTG